MIERLLEPWPHWSGRWWGIAIRVAVALIGLVVAGIMVFLGFFAATFKKSPAEWDLEAIGAAVIGGMTGISALALAIRPSRLSAGSVFAVVVVAGLVGESL